jgi:hypothetical protein
MESYEIPALPDTEEFWEDLLLYVRHKRVIPVIGAELLTIEDNGRQVPLYRAVAERLLQKYKIDTKSSDGGETLRPGHELNDAVCILAAAGKRIEDLYRRVDEILGTLLSTQKIPKSLREIASIRDFDLFVTTTPDNLMLKALNDVRFGGADLAHEIEYAPNLPGDRAHDIPEILPLNYAAVFYLFGKADVNPVYAIHDEDALEFPYMLQMKHPERMFAALQGHSLLLLGCTFHDWLSRFFIRLTNSERLSVDPRAKKEFLVGQDTAGDQSLTAFLKRFSHDSQCYAGDACGFVAELHRRWSSGSQQALHTFPQPSQQSASDTVPLIGSIFISYAHEDIAAARTLSTSLTAIGSAVAWFDKTDLKPGDLWDDRITGAIDRCRLFLPLLSNTTEQRDEGYFVREWKRAAERYKGILGRKFILPIVIDPDYDGDMTRYQLVPPVFKDFQYNHAPSGYMSDSLREELTKQLRGWVRKTKVP